MSRCRGGAGCAGSRAAPCFNLGPARVRNGPARRRISATAAPMQGRVTHPLIGDPELKVAKLYDMLPAEAGDSSSGRTAANNATVRSVFLVGPDKKIKAMLTYPMTTGRNFDEVVRILDSVQLTAKHQVATPVNWKPGDDVIIAGSVSDDEAKKRYPQGWRAPRPYLRYVPQPR